MTRTERRILLGLAGTVLGALLIWLSYQNLIWAPLESLSPRPGLTSGVLFWAGALLAAVSIGGWEVILEPLKLIAVMGASKYGGTKAAEQIMDRMFMFQAGERFQVDDDYFDKIGQQQPHPKYRKLREHKTLDDVPDYKQEIDLPNHLEEAREFREQHCEHREETGSGGWD